MKIIDNSDKFTRTQALREYQRILKETKPLGREALLEVYRRLATSDLFFLLVYVLGRTDIGKEDFLYARCREVQNSPNNHIDLWAREHYKSTIITYGYTIFELMQNPELTFGIFSHTKSLAENFLKQIKREFEDNQLLKDLFPDVLWENPQKQAPTWNVSDGIILKRKSNPKECSIEAHGLVEGQPTGKHFNRLIYDDVVTLASVATPDQIEKTTTAYRISLNLGAHGGKKRIIGTRYHFNDTYDAIMKSEKSLVPRIYPATVNGKIDGDPIFLTREQLDEKREAMGPYIYSCHGAGTKITMSDWQQKNIEDVKVGECVVGFVVGDKEHRTKLLPTKVLAVNKRRAIAVKSIMEDGREIIHTPDHKWWSGRTGVDKHNVYAELSTKYRHLHSLCSVFGDDIYTEKTENIAAWAYLAAMIDGEGACKHKVIQITQDYILHGNVCEKIEWALNECKIPYSICIPDGRTCKVYNLTGGRFTKLRLLNMAGEFLGKKEDIERQCYNAKDFGRKTQVKLVSQEVIGEIEVYNIQTESGNYIANGFCSKNCQMLQNPKEDGVDGFKEEWLRYYDRSTLFSESQPPLNFYILADPASQKKKNSDYSVFWVIATSQDNNVYIVDIVRDRLNLTERAKTLFRLVKEYKPLDVAYEHYGMQADVEHIQDMMEREFFRFNITKVGGKLSKSDRIKRLIPKFETGKIFLPNRLVYTNQEGKTIDLVKYFVEDEFIAFPVCAYDDMLDSLSRMFDIDLKYPDLNSYMGRRKRKVAETSYDYVNYGG